MTSDYKAPFDDLPRMAHGQPLLEGEAPAIPGVRDLRYLKLETVVRPLRGQAKVSWRPKPGVGEENLGSYRRRPPEAIHIGRDGTIHGWQDEGELDLHLNGRRVQPGTSLDEYLEFRYDGDEVREIQPPTYDKEP